MTAPLVSIICCTLDGEEHLDELFSCISSVVDDGCELVLLDDGSSDRTGAIFEQWAAIFPRVVTVHNRVPVGLGRAQAQAVDIASGHFVWLIDCDDRFPPNALTSMLEAAERNGSDVVVGRARAIESDGTVLRIVDADAAPAVLNRKRALEELLRGGIQGYTWTKLFRRELFDEGLHDDGFAPPLISTQCDFCRVATAIVRSETVTLIDDVVYDYVRHGASMMDGKTPPLENLAVARDHLVRIAKRELSDDPDRRRRIAHFTTWFLAASAIQIPFYVRSNAEVMRAGRVLASRSMRAVGMLDVLSFDLLVGLEAVLLAISPRLYQLVFSLTHRPTVG